MPKVFVLTVEQYYANHFRVVGVFSTEAAAQAEAEKIGISDTHIEELELDHSQHDELRRRPLPYIPAIKIPRN